ncbi:hypothetical protein DFH27DRAFT_614997 [Peziza echinospora]|nr:hypothetical protein DFH27DRAFT_614997 [Peziza echinospora]
MRGAVSGRTREANSPVAIPSLRTPFMIEDCGRSVWVLMEMGLEGAGGLFAGRISDCGRAGRITRSPVCSLAHGSATANSKSATADSGSVASKKRAKPLPAQLTWTCARADAHANVSTAKSIYRPSLRDDGIQIRHSRAESLKVVEDLWLGFAREGGSSWYIFRAKNQYKNLPPSGIFTWRILKQSALIRFIVKERATGDVPGNLMNKDTASYHSKRLPPYLQGKVVKVFICRHEFDLMERLSAGMAVIIASKHSSVD